ncbi:ABC transporter ATP-binding protein [Caldimonas tepidiphila]|uniref:ABC transporter ATP-binding protein n=1 Tax=Caldimonas tepidiphila TaxID=2315841 RepID=UPI000E5A56C5|nr:ABC transporter ATP-binding protein [Caldimonas tepidiphila]
MLVVEDLHAGYGPAPVLHGVALRVAPGEIVSLLGRNGSGRSTALKAVMGLVAARGAVTWQGVPLLGRAPHEIARQGVGYVPEAREVFPRLTVEQNLLLGVKPGRRPSPGQFERMYGLFPQLAARRRTPAGVLSGGEQQMLTLCRTLMGEPQLLLVDEPTEGLAPRLVAQVARCLLELQRQGVAVLLAEQKLAIALDVSQRCCVMGRGRIVFDGTPAGLRADAALRREWLEV